MKLLTSSNYISSLKTLFVEHFAVERNYLAFYSSHLDAIVADPVLMMLPFDDHMPLRGHAVFENCTVVNGSCFMLDRHIDRLLDSANQIRIEIPMTAGLIKEKVLDSVSYTGCTDCSVKMFISSGPGSVGIGSVPGASCLYLLVHKKAEAFVDIPNESTVRSLASGAFVETMKATSYLLNDLNAKKSEETGGKYGLSVNEHGFIIEGTVANAAFVLPGGALLTSSYPPNVIGITMKLVLSLARQLVTEGLLTSVEQRELTLMEAKKCTELLFATNDDINPVLGWDGVPVGAGTRGPVVTRLIELLRLEFTRPEHLTPIPYDRYNEY